MSLLTDIKSLTQEAFAKAFPAYTFALNDIEITQAKDTKHGDYQCNSAMRFTKVLGKNPREIAESVKIILATSSMFSELSVAGPGFINYRLAPKILEVRAQAMLEDKHLGCDTSHPEKVIIDFSSPNVAKEMHVGHLRSTIIGDCLARLFEFLGYEVLRLNHIGDWGTAFGMLICHIEAVAPDVLTGRQTANLTDLMIWYRESKQRFDADETFKKAAQLKVVALQQGDPKALKAWQVICAISEAAYQEIYDLLDIKITTRGESFYNPFLAETILKLNDKGLITESAGAKCIFIEGFTGQEGEPLPLIVQKSDGGYGYASTDMAAIWHRTQVEKGQRLLYVIDAGQGTHMAMVFAAAKKMGYVNDQVRAEHVPFGLVLGADGKKFKTRSGETEKLIDLLTEAINEAEVILKERGTPVEEIPTMAHALGINAVKYADLSSNRAQDYQFSYERMLRFEGNTAAYIMYSLVRVLSIQRKVGAIIPAQAKFQLEHLSEIALAMHLLQFSETIDYVARELYPHRLTDYLYQLANTFNAFFRDCRVEGDPNEASRLALLELTARVFKAGMQLLGLTPLERM